MERTRSQFCFLKYLTPLQNPDNHKIMPIMQDKKLFDFLVQNLKLFDFFKRDIVLFGRKSWLESLVNLVGIASPLPLSPRGRCGKRLQALTSTAILTFFSVFFKYESTESTKGIK